MKFGKIDKNKKVKPLELSQEEQEQQVQQKQAIFEEAEVDLPSLSTVKDNSNLAKSTHIKKKRKGLKIAIGTSVVGLVLILTVTALAKKEVPEVVDKPVQEEVVKHEEAVDRGSTDVSGVITIDKKEEGREEITFVDDYINLSFTYFNDYFIRERSSEGINIIRETLPVTDTKYSLINNTLTGVVPVIEMRNKQFTNYTILMQINNIHHFLGAESEYLYALEEAKETQFAKKTRKKSTKNKGTDSNTEELQYTEDDIYYYKNYTGQEVDYINYCPIQILEEVSTSEKTAENTDSSKSNDNIATESNNNNKITADNKEEKTEDVENEKKDSKNVEKPNGVVVSEKGTEYKNARVPVPCASGQYLTSRIAFDLPLGYTVKSDNTTVFKKEQAEKKKIEAQTKQEVVTENSKVEETPVEQPTIIINVTDEEEEVTEVKTDVKETKVAKEKLTEDERVMYHIESLFADSEGKYLPLEGVTEKPDYYTFNSNSLPVHVHSMVLEKEGRDVKYYEFSVLVGTNTVYLGLLGEIDENIKYILDDIKVLLDTLVFG